MEKINLKIDHTLLKPEANQDQIDQLCADAVKNNFRSVCVASSWVGHAHQRFSLLENNKKPLICSVIGFPHGNSNLISKILEIEDAQSEGADDLDVVVNIGAVKSQNWDYVDTEVREVREQAYQKTVKYIIETGYLNDFEMKKLCDILIKHEIDFVKTSTGYGPRGATLEDIKKLKAYGQNLIGIKASGGIADLDTAKSMIEAGADVIGTSKSLEIMRALRHDGKESNLGRY